MIKTKKVLILLILMLFLISILNTNVQALYDKGGAGGGTSSLEINPDNYKPQPTGDNSRLKAKAGTVLGIIQIVGSIISVIALAVIGIKYMVGSVEEKAEYKKTMLPYIIGAVLVFASSNLVSILYNIGQDINNN